MPTSKTPQNPRHYPAFARFLHFRCPTPRYWESIVGNGGVESACGWCKDRWGFSWQITPRRLLELTTSSDPEEARRAFDAMMTMTKIDIAALDAAVKDKAT